MSDAGGKQPKSTLGENRLGAPLLRVVNAATVPVALLAILALGAYLRLVGLNWDAFTHLHPDERFITMVENAIDLPRNAGEYFDSARSPLNPYNRGFDSFVYGTFPLFLVKWLGVQLNMSGYDEIHLVGRFVSALFDLGSVFLTFLIGRHLFGRWAALLGALLTSAAVIQVQQSHFFTFDTFVGFFLLASFLYAVRIWRHPRPYDYPLLGAFIGLAMASKINSALFGIVVAVLAIKELREVTDLYQNERMSEWMAVVGRYSAVALTGLLIFRVVEPCVFTGPGFLNLGLSPRFLNDMGFVSKLVSGEIDQPPGVQWANTPAYLFPWRNLVLWGMGLPFGLIGWAGLLFGAYRLLVRRDPRYLLIVGWTGFFFLYQGGQFAKTMRYFLPIVPLLALLGSHMLFEAFGRLNRGSAEERRAFLPRLGKYAIPAVAALVATSTVLYAFAFAGIYSRPITRIAATEWIFANIPAGSAVANEHWDDPLPLRWKGRDAGSYTGTMLELYNDDNPDKLTKLTAQLDSTQYIFLSSNRLYGSIPRMPMKYPLTTEYYRLLFSGELGFKLVKQFTSHPQLFGFEINDDGAEEIFSVYDHPKVLIFQKTSSYSPERTRQLLAAVPLDKVLPIKSAQTQYNGLLMSNVVRAAQEAGGTWSAIFDRQGFANSHPTGVWLFAIEMIGLLAFPLAWLLFRNFADIGYGLAKTAGIAVAAYVAWLLPSLHLLPFGAATVYTGVAAVAAVSATVLLMRWKEFRGAVAAGWRLAVVEEVVFLAAFALFWLIRSNNPDLWHPNFGGEKPMEFAYLNAVTRSTYFPPYDPWFAGGYINYYYFGYVIVASIIRLTGIVPAVAFNLAIPTIYALTAVGLFSFGASLWVAYSRGRRALTWATAAAGTATTAFVLVAGNLDGFIQRLESLWTLGGSQFKSTIPAFEGLVRAGAGLIAVTLGGKVLPALDFWRSTRLIAAENPTPIMEFPWFTFLYGDLHPHMMAMPLAAMGLALTLNIVLQGKRKSPYSGALPYAKQGLKLEEVLPAPVTGGEVPEAAAPARAGWGFGERLVVVLAAGLLVGMLQATNSWDWPTYLVLISAAFLVASFARDGAVTVAGAIDAALSAGGTFVTAQILFLPFTRSYELFYNGVDPSPAKTDVRYYLVMFGFLLFISISALAGGVISDPWHRFRLRSVYERFSGSSRWDRRQELWRTLVYPSPWMELLPIVVVAIGLITLVALFAGQFLVALVVILALLALLSLFERDAPPERMLLALFVGLGAVLTLLVEFVTIK
ncbi:MAG TPA: DUF2298 domain-containing protein, partial [Chloroflexota bacterium]